MTKTKLKIGDKVWGSINNSKVGYAIVKDITGNCVTITYPNSDRVCAVDLSRIYPADDLVLAIHKKDKWEVNRILGDATNKVRQDNGYFGAYSLIDYQGKQAIVYVDDRDAIVNLVCGFYDKIFYGVGSSTYWDGDYRWNSDMPIVVYKKRVGYNMVSKHSNCLLLDKWMKSIDPKWCHNGTMGYYLKGVDKQGNNVIISTNGSVSLMSNTTPQNINELLSQVKTWTNEEIMQNWIEKGNPCAFIHGMEYKGARIGKVSKERAIELFKTHHSFNCTFNSAEWRVVDCQVTLLFREYADSDYD